MLHDRYGNMVSTRSAAARDAYVEGVDRFLAAGPGVEEAFASAIAADEGFALAHLGLARHRHATGRGAGAIASLAAARAASNGVSRREADHINAIGLLIEGRGSDAYAAVRSHLVDHPRDAMVAQTCVGVFGLIGFSGQPEREAEYLAFTTSLAPEYGDDWWFLAQHAFAQMETGQTGPAAATIERALAGNPRNANAAHIRAHLFYENGEADAGLAWLDAWRRDYDRSALLHCHISWHVALWALERGDIEKMWRVIDQDLEPGSAWGPALNVLTDMAAILYRAELAGVQVPPKRWRTVSRYAAERFPKPGIAFADVHAALAHAMAGDGAGLARIIAEARGPAGDIVRHLAEGFGAIAAADWPGATRHLRAAMADHARIGGSRAQRDLVEFAMTNALLKQGQAKEARRFLAERRPRTSQWNAVVGL
jgi:hypothetical protein